MMIILSDDDIADLSPAARAEILKKLGGSAKVPTYLASQQLGEEYRDVDMEDVVDLTYKQVQKWMEGASDKTKLGLRVFAEKGPVIRCQELIDIGIDNVPHFQSRVTIRTRTVTGDRDAFLLGWDDWDEVKYGEGRYAVTPVTYQSLRRYFHLD